MPDLDVILIIHNKTLVVGIYLEKVQKLYEWPSSLCDCHLYFLKHVAIALIVPVHDSCPEVCLPLLS